ncbi:MULTISPECIES: hypothetical protein [unclassified Pseudomonas]|uniref:hypothetical protein n=1 Tax=unclassified Pseudomonas TaxID=196821 RepID=UPI000BC6C199|nr:MULTISPECIES: hypothetical protein [unclassified Pseudomonas]PVZ09760.1 hypothetical protein F474_04333 [Pseudomonas sp. URIL14HWK12:I12]PVZ21484.1 hypothetical protein F470_04279 [Pseudomonas sp. URIL14HWK12:I10]PVZ30335.1 hypothetical protein F472_04336 [Pseudomonas sp. URIL14HWK12:I11]SNZ18632.1 hypothetical protein SAMN05660463_04210 [Pseudomonas sp. URIL14HWK12:I9]
MTKLANAAVLDDAIVAFGAGLTAEEVSAARNLYRTATLVANAKFDKDTDPKGWYKQFNTVMVDLGWVAQHYQFDSNRHSAKGLTVDNVIDELLGVALNGIKAQVAAPAVLLDIASAALENLPADAEAYAVFNANSKTSAGGRVSVASFAKLDDHTLYLVMGVMDVRNDSAPKEVLILNWDSTSGETYEGAIALNIGLGELMEGADDIRARLDGVKATKRNAYLDFIG